MDILFLSHCVPNPPDKGEKIRAWHELNALAAKHRVHLACFARTAAEVDKAGEMQDVCASVFAELISPRKALAAAAMRFAFGGCLNTSFYRSSRMQAHVGELRSLPLTATLAYSSAVVQFAPSDVPLWIDMVDVDSEKWLEYGERRWPGAIYKLEGRRFRKLEAEYANRAECTFLTTPREQKLLQKIAPRARVEYWINGVDFERFDPRTTPANAELAKRQYLVFVGQMNYFPNVDACCWFAENVFGSLRSRWPNLEFVIVGRDPDNSIRRLANSPGIAVTGGVSDVRPYLANARAMVAPLRIARGVQNKVLEALAMGKRVLASPAVASTFGESAPEGVTRCESVSDYAAAFASTADSAQTDTAIRQHAQQRFSWLKNLQFVTNELDRVSEVAVSR
ncbi:MAG: TIGR03087 family PEP-CTERM/XrtA system glycosyltransferase [Bryobacterales bacterium]|nr:TIGR03087 family PEP-CTERM/XrtA system glycosyltransferase [Bryobacterales bacterium]